MMIFFYIQISKKGIALATFCFLNEEERKKGHFITGISSFKWY